MDIDIDVLFCVAVCQLSISRMLKTVLLLAVGICWWITFLIITDELYHLNQLWGRDALFQEMLTIQKLLHLVLIFLNFD